MNYFCPKLTKKFAMKNHIGKIVFFAVVVATLGCKDKKKEKEKAEAAAAAIAAAAIAPVEAAVKAQCNTWNSANSLKDATLLGTLYADTLVNFYGEAKKTRQACVDNQHNWFEKNPDAQQHILGDSIRIERLTNDTIKAYFSKELTLKGVPKTYDSYLKFLKIGDTYLVVAESEVGNEPVAKPKVVKPAAKPVAKVPAKPVKK
jgi:hypothetical protein